MIFQDMAAYRAATHQPRVAIVGGGVAGITIARKLGARGIPCVLFEAGGEEVTEESQDFYKGATIGDQYFDLDATRLRFLGGSSNHWAGWCRILDSYDFDAKPWIPNSGWPIRHADIEPFLDETRAILGLREFRATRPLTENLGHMDLIKSEAVHFGVAFRDELAASRDIAVVLNTTVLELAGNGRSVTGAKLYSAGAPAGDFAAPHFIVATGGLENSRLLLWSNARSNGGVVPNAAALGRYWMEHPMYWAGNAFITNKAALEFDHEGEVFMIPTPEALADRQTGNFHIQLETMPYHGMKKMIAEVACYAPRFTEWVSSAIDMHLQCSARVHIDWEQAPVESNHVALSTSERDAAGVPRIELHWKKGDLDRRTLVEAMRLFGEDIARKDIGRLHISDWVLNGEDWPQDMELAGNHHMGGTRMGTDLATSVVDADSRVHGMDNLYVAGSSVFATAGQCTPTTTITALSLRLADHLARTVSA
jgi:choline dehydrogenase-like flavoprotein